MLRYFQLLSVLLVGLAINAQDSKLFDSLKELESVQPPIKIDEFDINQWLRTKPQLNDVKEFADWTEKFIQFDRGLDSTSIFGLFAYELDNCTTCSFVLMNTELVDGTYTELFMLHHQEELLIDVFSLGSHSTGILEWARETKSFIVSRDEFFVFGDFYVEYYKKEDEKFSLQSKRIKENVLNNLSYRDLFSCSHHKADLEFSFDSHFVRNYSNLFSYNDARVGNVCLTKQAGEKIDSCETKLVYSGMKNSVITNLFMNINFVNGEEFNYEIVIQGINSDLTPKYSNVLEEIYNFPGYEALNGNLDLLINDDGVFIKRKNKLIRVSHVQHGD